MAKLTLIRLALLLLYIGLYDSYIIYKYYLPWYHGSTYYHDTYYQYAHLFSRLWVSQARHAFGYARNFDLLPTYWRARLI